MFFFEPCTCTNTKGSAQTEDIIPQNDDDSYAIFTGQAFLHFFSNPTSPIFDASTIQ